ncbi:hypothetical protein [Candidatus Uabimicrobium sp. HlEnr_7]|uniref:hypothetical protein n=1 Tax=Candidatus Uabimicrobium helgolandensis TaxID=3095367 RepID=UPI0035588465
MSYAVVLNPPRKKSPAQVAFKNKMRELGRLYKQSKSGNVPRWQQFVKQAISGAKFNSPVSSLLSGGISGASTYATLHFLDNKTRVKAFKEYLAGDNYVGKPKEAIEGYYGKQITKNLINGSVLTIANWSIAKVSQKTRAGKYVSPTGVAVGSAIATGLKIYEKWSDLKKCIDYPVMAVIEKEAKKYAVNNPEYFGVEYKSAIETVLVSSDQYANGSKYINQQEEATGDPDLNANSGSDSDLTNGIQYEEYQQVAGPIYYG